MKHSCLSKAAALLILTAGCAAAAESRVAFREAFDGTAEKPAGFTDVCSINEAPPSLKSLAFRPADNKPAEVYKGLFLLPKGIEAGADYEFSFRFSFPRDSKKAFTLSLVAGDRADKKSQSSTVVSISEKAVGIRPPKAGLLPPFGGTDADLDLRAMPNGLWQRALVRSRGGTLELFVDNDGRFMKVAQADGPAAPLAGFNFGGSTAVNLDDIEIRRLDPPPAGDFRDEQGLKVANVAAEYKMEVPEGATAISSAFRLGTYPAQAVLKIGYADGSERVIDLKTFAARYDKPVQRQVNELDKAGKLAAVTKTVPEPVFLPDSGVSFRERPATNGAPVWSLSLNIRPNIKYRYTAEQVLEVVSAWNRYPAASQTFIGLELRPDDRGAELWLQGRCAGRLNGIAKIRSLAFVLPAGAALRDPAVSTKPFDPARLVLDVNRISNPGALADASVALPGLKTGEAVVEGVPFKVAGGAGNADMGVCREGFGSYALECDGYLSRTPFDGMPESLMWGVPVAPYIRAWALCAVEDDPDKVPVITARLTKFLPNSEMGRGPAIADTEITLPRAGEPMPAGVRKVGDVKSGGRSLPLYLVEFKMDVGNIQEILYQEKPAWLDFEFLGKRHTKDNFYMDRSRKPSDDEISGVHLFAATLERSPVEMQIMPTVFGNVYQPDEKPVMTATLRARQKADVTLGWVVRDLQGQVLEQGRKPFAFEKAGQETTLEIPFAQKEFGWYGVEFSLEGKGAGELLNHKASFALIERDTRKAGYESPYFTWNFGGPHGTIKDIAVAGPLLLKAGIRHTHVASEAVGAPWKLTMGQLPRLSPKSKDPQVADKEMEALIRTNMVKFPHATMALIFHESGGGPFPLELAGGKTVVDEKQAAYDTEKAAQAVLIAKAYRKYAPQIRTVIGNSGTATPGLLASLFRAKFPRELIDFLGEESVGMTMPPELSVGRENWMLRETARVFGYGEIPVSACYEWKCRRSRHLGLQKYAEFGVRDILIGHAWKQPLIPTAGLPDVASSYYNTVWGDEAFTPYPQVYPKPTFPAVATATRVLDGVTFKRMIPTGSLTVYALEFTRGNGFVYAFWTARGELEAALAFEKDAAVTLTGTYGRSSDLKSTGGALKLPIGEGAVYLTSPVALKAVSVPLQRAFPREQLPAGIQPVVASSIAVAADWKLDGAVDSRLDMPVQASSEGHAFRRPGQYELRQVRDEQKGDCLELELLQTNECPVLVQEYAFLRLVSPVELAGKPATIGLWVKGNSSWGKIFWEIEDAEGERWFSAGSGGYGCDVYDWPELAGLNFDGWHFLQFPITSLSPVKVESPGQNGFQWQHNGAGNHRIDYPIKATAVAVSMSRKALNLLEMEPVSPVIRLKDLSAY